MEKQLGGLQERRDRGDVGHLQTCYYSQGTRYETRRDLCIPIHPTYIVFTFTFKSQALREIYAKFSCRLDFQKVATSPSIPCANTGPGLKRQTLNLVKSIILSSVSCKPRLTVGGTRWMSSLLRRVDAINRFPISQLMVNSYWILFILLWTWGIGKWEWVKWVRYVCIVSYPACIISCMYGDTDVLIEG